MFKKQKQLLVYKTHFLQFCEIRGSSTSQLKLSVISCKYRLFSGMLVDCSWLIEDQITTNITNISIWLNGEDLGRGIKVMAGKFWTLWPFTFGIIIVVILTTIIPVIIAYICYPKCDKRQKKLKLRILKVDNILRDDCKPILLKHVDEEYITDLIMDYADIIFPIMTSSIDESPFDRKLLHRRLFLYLLLCALLILPSLLKLQVTFLT